MCVSEIRTLFIKHCGSHNTSLQITFDENNDFVLARHRKLSVLPQHQMSDNRRGVEIMFVLMCIVSELTVETPEVLETSICSFMPACCFFLCHLFTSATMIFWLLCCFITSASSLSFNHFTWSKQWFNTSSADCQIMPFTSMEWTVTRNNFTSLNACADSTLKPETSEFVTLVAWIKWMCPQFQLLVLWIWSVEEFKIHTIMIDLASPSLVQSEVVFKLHPKDVVS